MDAGSASRVICFDSDCQTIHEFIEEYKPASIPCIHVEWLTVSTQQADKIDIQIVDTVGLQQSWESLCLSSQTWLTTAHIERLAISHNVLSGKWMIFLDRGKVDAEWAKIAIGIVKEGLAHDAKVSTTHVKPNKSGLPKEEKIPVGSHVICVWSSDFTDHDDVFALRGRLADLGFSGKLFYKPDAYSICGVYQGNSLGLPAAKFCI